ncbi:Rv2732c family membrane protein [Corynebacterium vitaeruminis]|uniref:Transmembrane protein n=1 Tax=Corynebacterium vitaeruminis DSM 20294 TaxID=1224164 RepID=W5Y187_9CORY|nr:hypothetical protein [Corynebacterium vitaeruminis]AHI23001.1 hypothetical protein B843_08080 [Corynebacterium vitaeruminis DSM 20294]
MENSQSVENTRSLARSERKANSRVELGSYAKFMIIAFGAFLVSLALPHSGGVKGLDVLFLTSESHAGGTKVAEYVFVILGSLALIVFNGLLLITKRTVFANISFLLSGMALLTSLFGLWMRMQSAETQGEAGVSYGFYLEVFAVILQVYALSCTVLARSDEQKELAAKRAADENLDEVGYAQRSALVSRQLNTSDTNPLLVDDRRKKAAEKRKHH